MNQNAYRRDFILRMAAVGVSLSTSLQAVPALAQSPVAALQTILVVGDSLSAEYGLARGAGWVALLEMKLDKENKTAAVVNASVSGETSSGGRSRLPALLKQHNPFNSFSLCSVKCCSSTWHCPVQSRYSVL